MDRGNIIIVDSSGENIHELEDILKELGYSVAKVGDALKAVGQLNQTVTRLVFVSLLNNFNEGLRHIRGIRLAYPDAGIVAIVDKEHIDNLSQVFNAGASEFLPLPLSRQGVTNILNKLFEKYQLNLEYSKVLKEGLEYIDLLNIYQKCMKILVTTDIDQLSGLVLDIFFEILQVKKGCIWCSFKEGEGFKKMKSTSDDLPEMPDLNEDEMNRINLEGILKKGDKLWISIKGQTQRTLGIVALVIDKPLEEKQENLLKSITGFAAVAFDTAIRTVLYNQYILKDPLTEAYSFSYFSDYIEKELSKSKRFKRNFSIILLRIENLAQYKNEFPEYTINKTLKRLIEILLECVRGTDIVAKKSDDEYYVLLPETDYFGSLVTLRRFNSSIKDKLFLIDGSKSVDLRVKISSGTFPRDGGTLDMLLYRIRKRLDSQDQSIYRKLNLENKDFWTAFDLMVTPSKEVQEITKESSEELEGESCQAIFPENLIKDISEIFQVELNLNTSMRGAFFLKLGRIKERFLPKFATKISDSSAFRIYRFESEDITETSPLIRFIRIPHEDAEKGNFLIAVTEEFLYGLFFKEIEKNKYSAFHTSDPFLIENIIAKLQERYLIYREM